MKLYRNFLFVIGIITITACSSNPGEEAVVKEEPVETFSFVEGHKPVWKQAIIQVMELADAMPEDQYGYQPHDSVRTFAEQLAHIGGASLVITNLFLNDISPEQIPPTDVSNMTKEEIKSMVKENLEGAWTIMEGMSDQKLQEKIKSFAGNDITRLEGFLLVHDHLTNHKAKANLYVRMSGNPPPSYRYY